MFVLPKTICKPVLVALFAALSVCTIGTALTFAAKPGGGGGGGGNVPAGHIYYHWSSNEDVYGPEEYRGYWRMNADGSRKQLSGYQPGGFATYYKYQHLSYFTHQGYRWYLESELDALLAVREDGDPNFRTVLLEQTELSGTPWISTCRWSKNDSFISFVAEVGGTNPEPAKIWVADVAFDELTGLPELTTTPQSVVEEVDPSVDIGSLDWSPDGTQVAYGIVPRSGKGTVKMTDFLTSITRVLVADAYQPAWSPDGLKIAFIAWNAGVYTINPDGSGVQQLTNNNGDTEPEWSLDSKFIAFSRRGFYKGNTSIYISDVFRVSATGGSAVNLTKDIDGYAESVGW
jgi:hypothetical protein